MCAAMLRWIRRQMLFEPRKMRAVLVPPGCDPMPRRTYQDYEAGNRGIPADLASRIREIYRRDREHMAGIGARIDAALDREFPGGMIPSIQAEKEEEYQG